MGCFRWLCRIPLSCRRAIRHPEFCFTDQNCLFYYLDLIFRRFLGRFLVFFIYALISFMTFVVGAIILPHESLHKPQWSIVVLLAFACYLIFNIIYHYYKASTSPPATPPKSNEAPQCYRCHNHKPEGAHHCGICDKCILDMDHHCVFLNACVDAGNHRHFLQFIGFLTVGCITFVTAGFPTFYDNYWRPSKATVFCHAELSAWPWHKSICADGGEFVMACIFFCYFLCAIVVLLVGGLFWWNFVLISTGKTYIDFLQDERPSGLIWRLIWPFANQGFVQHWKRFLGLYRKRTFLSHILLPSSHPSGRYAFDDEPLLSTTTVL